MSESFLFVDPPNEAPIETLWAFVSVDEKGNEGLLSMMMGDRWVNLITGRERVARLMKPAAEAMAAMGNKKVRCVIYHRDSVLEEYGGGS